MKKWVHRTDLLEIRFAKEGEMVKPGQFAKPGDMIIIHKELLGDDFLIRQKDLGDYVRVEVINE